MRLCNHKASHFGRSLSFALHNPPSLVEDNQVKSYGQTQQPIRAGKNERLFVCTYLQQRRFRPNLPLVPMSQLPKEASIFFMCYTVPAGGGKDRLADLSVAICTGYYLLQAPAIILSLLYFHSMLPTAFTGELLFWRRQGNHSSNYRLLKAGDGFPEEPK